MRIERRFGKQMLVFAVVLLFHKVVWDFFGGVFSELGKWGGWWP